jgi:hypothetical protein
MVTFTLTTIGEVTRKSSKAPYGILNVEGYTRQLCFVSKTGGFIAVLSLFAQGLLSRAEVSKLFEEIKKTDMPESFISRKNTASSTSLFIVKPAQIMALFITMSAINKITFVLMGLRNIEKPAGMRDISSRLLHKYRNQILSD